MMECLRWPMIVSTFFLVFGGVSGAILAGSKACSSRIYWGCSCVAMHLVILLEAANRLGLKPLIMRFWFWTGPIRPRLKCRQHLIPVFRRRGRVPHE